LTDQRFRSLAEEQAALRRVATLVAYGTSTDEVFATVTEEISQLLSVEYAGLSRYGPDRTVTLVANAGSRPRELSQDHTWRLGGTNINTLVFETGRPVRIDDYSGASGPLSAVVREYGIGSGVGAPVVVNDRLWGAMSAYATLGQSLPEGTEARLVSFSELLGIAIANAESRAELAELAQEQAALRRVAVLVARGVPPEEVFAAVTEEVGRLLPVESAIMGRFDPDNTVTTVGVTSKTGTPWPPVGSRWPLEGKNLATIVSQTGRPARFENYTDASGPVGDSAREHDFRSAVGAPIVVEGHLWGAMVVASTIQDAPLPPDAETRLVNFTELLETAIANAEGRVELALLAEEQAALGRVATLVASGVRPEEVFAAVTEEVGRLLSVEYAGLGRYEPHGTLTFVASWGRAADFVPVGSQWSIGKKDISTLVFETGRPARIDDYAVASGPLSSAAGEMGVRSSVGTPIVVEGRLWGVIGVASSGEQPLPPDTEPRLASFTELIAMAVGNAESSAELKASRARIVAAGDEMRRRIERDLHDGAQQQLVSLMLELRTATAAQPCTSCDLQEHLERAEQKLDGVQEALREISRGIHPAILSKGGLGPACKALARRSAVPVDLKVRAERRLPEHVEVAAYYVFSEALTNAAKHADASVVTVELEAGDTLLRLAIHDDGVGGADPTKGSGLVGLADRIEAINGRLEVTSPANEGTSLSIVIPVEDWNSDS
jgi:GAF domain-containing protein